ncbi:hypothetical protein [Marinomonas mediterranea]|uniref:hypothetical protein n=1 Tax=Marinomonas mediterranea TaxID=119864 RepID=UPI00234A01DE|nr:hypothetical protein [Marinomonas mediterranea]WCN07770.1 hypothetical protein GV055_01935 [Marinomonas mediterranea]
MEDFTNWLPIEFEKSNSDYKVRWMHVGDKSFTKPFFYDSIQSLRHQNRPTKLTNLNALEHTHCSSTLPPTAFIFHTSRCGSTLMSQMLSQSQKHLVFSEPMIVDCVLKYHLNNEPNNVKIIRNVIKALGQRRNLAEKMFIKLDSWHISRIPLLRQAFPDTPFYLLYRSPLEILKSHQKQRGIQMVPGLVSLEELNLDNPRYHPADLDHYCLLVLKSFFLDALRYINDIKLINYTQLPNILWEAILPELDIELDTNELDDLRKRSSTHSKQQYSPFNGDQFDKEITLSEKATKTLNELSILYEKLCLQKSSVF